MLIFICHVVVVCRSGFWWPRKIQCVLQNGPLGCPMFRFESDPIISGLTLTLTVRAVGNDDGRVRYTHEPHSISMVSEMRMQENLQAAQHLQSAYPILSYFQGKIGQASSEFTDKPDCSKPT
jgi:hypothetical protein